MAQGLTRADCRGTGISRAHSQSSQKGDADKEEISSRTTGLASTAYGSPSPVSSEVLVAGEVTPGSLVVCVEMKWPVCQHSQANHSKMRQTPDAHPSHQYPSLHCTTYQPRPPPPAVLGRISAVLLGTNPIGILMTCSIAGIRNRSIILTD
ncbi:unnamed protein product [Arctogadus glacialis]